MQLDTLTEQDDRISKELQSISVSGTKLEKNIIVVPIDNTLLYVEPIYQVMLNESQVPILKKVIVASGNKVAIGDNLNEALTNLLSAEASNIQVDTGSIEELIKEIINANKNLTQSSANSDWSLMGQDISTLQNLINQLEVLENQKQNTQTNDGNTTTNNMTNAM